MSTQPGSKKKRFLAPQEKYEIWMQLVRGEWERFGPPGEPYRAACDEWPTAV